jgi:formamidopyrimidine-DNA glycosylase
MPELPEVETVTRGLRRQLVGRVFVRVACRAKKLREPLAAPTLSRGLRGRQIVAVNRRAKFIQIVLDDGKILIVHLGMTGSLRMAPTDEKPRRHDHALFFFVGADKNPAPEKLVYHDPRKFGLIKLFAGAEDFEQRQKLGVEPLTREFSGAKLAALCQKSSAPIKLEIMKQERVVGVGNIYASEALHRAGVAPTRAAKTLTAAEFSQLAKAIKQVLTAAIKAGGTTISDFRQLNGNEGNFTRQLRVYDRAAEKCLRAHCAGAIEKITQGGRSTYFCPQCQK